MLACNASAYAIIETSMNILSGNEDFFGLDIGTTAIRLVQMRGSAGVKTLINYAYMPIDNKTAVSDAKADQQKLAQSIAELIGKAQLSTKNVAVGLSSQRVFSTVVDTDRLPKNELAKAIRYEADSLIPTPIAESKIGWELLGDSPKDKDKVEILLSSVTNEFLEKRIDLLESIGLNVIAFEPDTMALTRAVLAPTIPAPQMVVDIGSKSTDIVVVMGNAPRLTRSIPTGIDSIINSAVQNLNVDQKQAEQFVLKFGLSKEKLEGQIYNAIISTVEGLVGEIEKSIKFFETRYTGSKIERVVVTGGASILPEFPVYLANKFSINIEIGNPWRNVSFEASRQNELLAVANHFAVAAGLAEREA
jgi:type IV pilus assembly protein PilM